MNDIVPMDMSGGFRAVKGYTRRAGGVYAGDTRIIRTDVSGEST